jgi:hypothetical protein
MRFWHIKFLEGGNSYFYVDKENRSSSKIRLAFYHEFFLIDDLFIRPEVKITFIHENDDVVIPAKQLKRLLNNETNIVPIDNNNRK